jgi:hypothetical protein
MFAAPCWLWSRKLAIAVQPYTAKNFGMTYSRIRISQNSFPNLIYIVPKSFMRFCQELQDPKRKHENQIWTSIKYLVTGLPKQDSKNSHKSILVQLKSTMTVILVGHLLVWQICSPNWDLLINSFVERLCNWPAGPMSKYLQLMQGSWVRILYDNFDIFSCWHSWETRYKSGFHSSFWDFICGIWNWGVASSFWNHVIQISIRHVHFKDIYSQLWIV